MRTLSAHMSISSANMRINVRIISANMISITNMRISSANMRRK